jgi:hypothetical protein
VKHGTHIVNIVGMVCAMVGLMTSCGPTSTFTPVTSVPLAVATGIPCVAGNCPEMSIQLAVAGTSEGSSLVIVDQRQVDWKMTAVLAEPKARKVMVHVFDAPAGIVVSFQNTEVVDFDEIPSSSAGSGSMTVLVRDVTRCAALTNNATKCDTPATAIPTTLQSGEQKLTFSYVKKPAGWSVEHEQMLQAALIRQQNEAARQEALRAACAGKLISGGLTAILTGSILGGLATGFLDCAKMGALN